MSGTQSERSSHTQSSIATPAEVDVAEKQSEIALADLVRSGRRLYNEKCSALRAWKANASHDTFHASSTAFAAWDDWCEANLPALLSAAEKASEHERKANECGQQVAGMRETILSAANICEHWADESRNGGWSTHQVEPNRRLAASLRKAALGAAP